MPDIVCPESGLDRPRRTVVVKRSSGKRVPGGGRETQLTTIWAFCAFITIPKLILDVREVQNNVGDIFYRNRLVVFDGPDADVQEGDLLLVTDTDVSDNSIQESDWNIKETIEVVAVISFEFNTQINGRVAT